MKRYGKWGILALAVGGLVAFAGRMVISQQPTAPVPTDPVRELFEKARPHLETVLGAKLQSVPKFHVISASQLRDLPVHDLDAHIRWHFSHLQGETLTKTKRIARQIIGSAIAAEYVEGTDNIVVATDNLRKIAAWNQELAPVNSEAFLQLALVHEVVRWQLDQRYQLGKLRGSCRDPEEFHAFQAIVEGRAQAATRQVAVRLGSQVIFPLLAQISVNVPDDAPDPALKAVSQTALQARYHACKLGLAFWDGLNVADAETLVFARPPRQMTVLARPERWLAAQAANQADLATVLQPLENVMPAADWLSMQQTWTPAMLSQVAVMLGAPKERADKVGQTWYEGRSLIWTRRSQPDRQVALSVVRHESDVGARAYFGFAVDLQRKQDTLPPGTCGPTVRVIDSKSIAVKLDGFDEAVRNEKRIAFGDSEPVPVSLLLARAGSLVIECTLHGQNADTAIAEWLVQEVGRKGR